MIPRYFRLWFIVITFPLCFCRHTSEMNICRRKLQAALKIIHKEAAKKFLSLSFVRCCAMFSFHFYINLCKSSWVFGICVNEVLLNGRDDRRPRFFSCAHGSIALFTWWVTKRIIRRRRRGRKHEMIDVGRTLNYLLLPLWFRNFLIESVIFINAKFKSAMPLLKVNKT